MKSDNEIRQRQWLKVRQRLAILSLILGGGQVLVIRTHGEDLGWHNVTLVVTAVFLFFVTFLYGGGSRRDDPST
jgi:hypothetical protein